MEKAWVLDLEADVAAVAISADESILAAVEGREEGDGPGAWRVSLIDRPSLGRLGRLTARVGNNPRLRFSPVADLLLVTGQGGAELWNLPISDLKPKEPLGEKNLLWRVTPEEGETLGDARFLATGKGGHAVLWSAGGKLYRREAKPGAAPSAAALWEGGGEERVLSGFAVKGGGAALALTFAASKEVGLLAGEEGGPERWLGDHRFPVTTAFFDEQGDLLSLDSGRNMIRRGPREQAGGAMGESLFLKSLPRDFRATGGRALGPNHLLLVGPSGKGSQGAIAHLLATATGDVAAALKADGPEGLMASPTGRYILVARGRAMHIHRFTDPTPPLEYVRRLRALEAYQTAQSYVRLMDDKGLPRRLKADLLTAVGQDPPGKALEKALQRLRESEQEGQAERIRRRAERVLALSQNHPEGLAALRRLADLQEAEVMRQAREAFNLGQNRIAISLLSSSIPEESRRYPEAMDLIRQAEAKRTVETILMQAREKLSLGDPIAAEALVNEALRRAPQDEAALALAEEVDDRQGVGPWGFLIAGVGVILLTGAGGLAILRLRKRNQALKAGASSTAGTSTRSAVRREGGQGTPAGRAGHAPPGPKPRGASGEPGGPRDSFTKDSFTKNRGRTASNGGGAATGTAAGMRRAVVEGLVKEIEARIHAVRHGDLHKRFTASLMEWEAELESIARNLGDPHAELGGLHRRLRAIASAVKGLKLGEDSHKASGGKQSARGASRQNPPANDSAGEEEQERTYYELLELGPEASAEDIRTAYHRLLKQYHPDLHNASRFDWIKSQSEQMSKRISEAYQILSDDRSRARYDKELQKSRGGSP